MEKKRDAMDCQEGANGNVFTLSNLGARMVQLGGALAIVAVVALWQWNAIENTIVSYVYSYPNDATHYEILQVSKGSSLSEISGAYRAFSKQYHPDKTKAYSKPLQEVYKQNFYRISAAYDVLSNPQKRQEYDHSLQSKKNMSIWSMRWQYWSSFITWTSCGYIFGILGLLTIVLEYIVYPIREKIATWRIHSIISLEERQMKLQQARERLQEKYTLQAQLRSRK